LNEVVAAAGELTLGPTRVDFTRRRRQKITVFQETDMKRARLMQKMLVFMSGATILQIGGCTTSPIELIQTVFLGVSAAGALAIIRNL
jgi:hypothetical protein